MWPLPKRHVLLYIISLGLMSCSENIEISPPKAQVTPPKHRDRPKREPPPSPSPPFEIQLSHPSVPSLPSTFETTERLAAQIALLENKKRLLQQEIALLEKKKASLQQQKQSKTTPAPTRLPHNPNPLLHQSTKQPRHIPAPGYTSAMMQKSRRSLQKQEAALKRKAHVLKQRAAELQRRERAAAIRLDVLAPAHALLLVTRRSLLALSPLRTSPSSMIAWVSTPSSAIANTPSKDAQKASLVQTQNIIHQATPKPPQKSAPIILGLLLGPLLLLGYQGVIVVGRHYRRHSLKQRTGGKRPAVEDTAVAIEQRKAAQQTKAAHASSSS